MQVIPTYHPNRPKTVGHPAKQIDPSTGEVLETPDFPLFDEDGNPLAESAALVPMEPLAAMVATGKMPIHIAKAEEFQVPPKVLSSYIGVTAEPLTSGKVIEVIGAIVWFSGPFNPKDGGPMQPGYYKLLLKSAETIAVDVLVPPKSPNGKPKARRVSRHKVYSTSSKGVADMLLSIMATLGWFDWDESVWLSVTGNQSDGYKAEVLDPDDEPDDDDPPAAAKAK